MPSRNCGTSRTQNGLYICIETSEFGRPVEYFLLDSTIPTDLKPFRTPIIIERKDGSKINDIVVYIGKQFYPFVSDYIEECRLLGISRRIPRDFPIEKLTPNESRMFLVHERAIPLFDYAVQKDCPRKMKHSKKPGSTCVFDLWSLSALENFGDKHKVTLTDSWNAKIKTVATEYDVHLPTSPQVNLEQKKIYKYQAGIFASFFIGHLEYVNEKGKIPTKLKERIKKSNFDIKICEE